MRRDAEHYNYFRDYDPSIGRYVESDPIGLFGGLNTYLYTKANPLKWSDSKGQVIEWAGAVGIVVYTCYEIYCVKKGLNGCAAKYQNHKDPLSPDRAAFAKCAKAVVTVCASLGAFGYDPLGAAAGEAGAHAGEPGHH